MDGASNGGMLYHEVQESKLCAVHCVNTVLQGPFFSEFDLAALASDLDTRERQVMSQQPAPPSPAPGGGDFLSVESHNVSMGGDFSIQVLEKALEVWDLQVIPFSSPLAEPAQVDPDTENAFICHLHDHWFCIRKVNGEWYNFDSLSAAPTHLSKFYLAAYLDSLRSASWSIFIVRGNFPAEFPSESSNGYGQWLSPEDADRIIKSCSDVKSVLQPKPITIIPPYQDMLSDGDDEDLKAAIAASLMDSAQASTSNKEPESKEAEGKSELDKEQENKEVAANEEAKNEEETIKE
ncbi:Ataxin-3 homolog [Linum grandiflorum]